MKKFSLLILTLSFLLFSLYIIQQSTPIKPCLIKSGTTCLKTTTRVINNKTYTLYIADTAATRQQGLSDVKNMPDDVGLLFKFSTPGFHSFWMKDMHFSLDFIFYKDGKEVDELKNISPKTYPKIFTAKEEFDEAVEIKARH